MRKVLDEFAGAAAQQLVEWATLHKDQVPVILGPTVGCLQEPDLSETEHENLLWLASTLLQTISAEQLLQEFKVYCSLEGRCVCMMSLDGCYLYSLH